MNRIRDQRRVGKIGPFILPKLPGVVPVIFELAELVWSSLLVRNHSSQLLQRTTANGALYSSLAPNLQGSLAKILPGSFRSWIFLLVARWLAIGATHKTVSVERTAHQAEANNKIDSLEKIGHVLLLFHDL